MSSYLLTYGNVSCSSYIVDKPSLYTSNVVGFDIFPLVVKIKTACSVANAAG